MNEKKPVYNGYEEHYVNGAELKDLFKGRYFTTGRHHSVVLGISIAEYLDLIGINDSTKYRIFINEHFCRVMREDTDGMISFFGHTTLERVKNSITLTNIHLEKNCPVCGATMKFRRGKYGEFLGCSRYPDCKKTINIPIIGNT